MKVILFAQRLASNGLLANIGNPVTREGKAISLATIVDVVNTMQAAFDLTHEDSINMHVVDEHDVVCQRGSVRHWLEFFAFHNRRLMKVGGIYPVFKNVDEWADWYNQTSTDVSDEEPYELTEDEYSFYKHLSEVVLDFHKLKAEGYFDSFHDPKTAKKVKQGIKTFSTYWAEKGSPEQKDWEEKFSQFLSNLFLDMRD